MDEKERGESLATGMVIEALPSTLFKIKLDDGQELMAHLSGKMRLHRIRVLVGDKVSVKLDEYGSKTGNRIVKRL
ncbi:MAG: translation initiation factor IF-1 [bacterium]|nr:translation initiation factor IF-1 [bacterium]